MDEQTMNTMGTGAIQSPEDYRYINLKHIAGAIPDMLPDNYHIDYSQIPDVNQRKIGACTAHATSEIRMHRELRKKGSTPVFSPRFIYALSKSLDGVKPLTNEGTYPVMPLKIGKKYGFATTLTINNDTSLPFDEYIYNREVKKIPAEAYEEALKYKIPSYVQVGKINNVSEAELKKAIFHGKDGVNITIQVGNEWWTSVNGKVSWNSSDILPIRKPIKVISGHDITATGWETEKGRTKIFFRNSWGTTWGNNDNGWFWLDQHKINEAWMITPVPDSIIKIVKELPKKEHFHYKWLKNLRHGDKGIDVQFLQIALKIMGTFPFDEPVTEYYGRITQRAVIAFQVKYNIADIRDIQAADGGTGPRTRQRLNYYFN